MKLGHYMFETPLEFTENIHNVLVIENPNCMTNFIQILDKQISGEKGEFVLVSDDYVQMDISKNIDLTIDIFRLDLNNRKVLNGVLSKLKTMCMASEMYVDSTQISADIINYVDKALSEFNINLEYESDFDISVLFKLLNIKISKEYNTLAEKVVDYIDIMSEICKTQCFVFVNLKSYIPFEDLSKIYKHVEYKKINLLLIESIMSEKRISKEKYYIIDSDLCAIY